MLQTAAGTAVLLSSCATLNAHIAPDVKRSIILTPRVEIDTFNIYKIMMMMMLLLCADAAD